MIRTFQPDVGEEELTELRAVFETGWLGLGDWVARFEQRVAEALDVPHVVAVDRGTAALHLALDALGLDPGDEVIVPSLTYVASVQAILMAGLRPVFCEVREEDGTIDVEDALARAGVRTRAVMPVHYAGQLADVPALSGRGLRVVADAAHAFGGASAAGPVGRLGDAVCFSFDAIKSVTCGDGGAVATGDEGIAARVRRRHNLGMEKTGWLRQGDRSPGEYRVLERGMRYHMTNTQAAIGLTQLRRFPGFRARRRDIARRYDEAFADLDGLRPLRRDDGHAVPWAYVVRVGAGRRDALADALRAADIQTLVQFPPNHLQPAFAEFRVDLPRTERLWGELLTLPLHTRLSDADVAQVVRHVRAFFGVREGE